MRRNGNLQCLSVTNGGQPPYPRGLAHGDQMDGQKAMTRPQVAVGPPSTRYQPWRSGRSSALPYPPDWHDKDRDALIKLQDGEENWGKIGEANCMVESGILIVAGREK